MQKNFALLGLLILATSAIGLAVWLSDAPTHAPGGVPLVAAADSTGTGNAAAGSPEQAAKDAMGAGREAGGAIVRVAAEASADDPASDTRPCQLRVVVGPSDQPMAHVEVRVRTVEQAAATGRGNTGSGDTGSGDVAAATAGDAIAGGWATGHTGADGALEFTFVGGHGKHIVVHTAIGARAETTLSANQPKELRLLLTPRAVATGRVVDGANRPVADAEIVLQRWPYAGSPNTTWSGQLGAMGTIARSDREGRFRVALACGGRIGARHPDHAASATYLVRASRSSGGGGGTGGGGSSSTASTALVQAFELLLRNTHGTIEGTVRDHLGSPVAGARIALDSRAARPARAERASLPHHLTSDAAGRFQATGLATGPIRWTANAAGHGWTSGQIDAADRSTATLDIRLPAPMTLVGTVVDVNTGKPMAGVRVQAGRKATLCYAETTTDGSGSYVLTGLGCDPGPTKPARTRALSVLAKPPTAATCTKASIRVEPGTTQTWNVRCGAAAANLKLLRGFVLDQRELPLPGWAVLVRQRGHAPRVFQTDANGHFAIPVSADTQRVDEVSAFAPGTPHAAFAAARQRKVDVNAVLRLIVHPASPGSIFGRVVDHGYRGVPATISCWHEQRREYARFHADEEGRFDLAIPAGTIDLTFEHPGLVTQKLAAVALQADTPRDLRTVQLPLGGGLFGLVLGPGGSAPTDCQLALTGGSRETTLEAECKDGSYRFSDAAPGDYTLIVQGAGIAGSPFPVTIEAGVDLQRDFDIQVGIKRFVRVLVPAGAGDRVTLALRADDSTLSWLATAAVERERGAAEGVAVFETWMQSGSYRAAARSSGGLEHSTTITYEQAGQPDVILRLTR